ncbi:MAG: hypothetical protein VX189_10925, partial [Planctomycetota bacterium]|nr:hypothetical protein [Planctomycetota bacterium]
AHPPALNAHHPHNHRPPDMAHWASDSDLLPPFILGDLILSKRSGRKWPQDPYSDSQNCNGQDNSVDTQSLQSNIKS